MNHLIDNLLGTGKLDMIFLIGAVLFGGTFVGRLFQKIKIPQVVGYICLGAVLGKTGFGWIGEEALNDLAPFSTVALGFIGFMIGGELKGKTIKRYGRQFSFILVMEAMGAFILVAPVMTLMGMLVFHDNKLALAFGLLMGAISSATAPAATTDVLWENKSKGPLTTIVLGIVAMDDAFALLLFALMSSIAGILTGAKGEGLGAMLGGFAWEMGIAVLLGVAAGFILKRIVRSLLDDDKILAFSIGAILVIIGAARLLEVDIIMATMTLGVFITNFIPRKSKKTFSLVENFTPPIYVLFFVLVGANLNIRGMSLITVLLALLYVFSRTGGKAVGAILGSILSKAPRQVRRYLPFCLLSQAGVAIGLSIAAGKSFSGPLGDTILLVVTATTFIVQLAGPGFVRMAVIRSGEAGRDISEEDLIRQYKARDLADTDIPVIQEKDHIETAMKIFAERDNLYYPVVDEQNKMAGILSIDKIKDTFMASDFSGILLVHDIMEQAVYTCTGETGAGELSDYFNKSGIPSIPLVDHKGNVEGIIESRRLRKILAERLEEIKNQSEDKEELET